MHIADSALVTKDNLLSINDDTYKFISRLPATFKLEKELRERAATRPELWNDITNSKGEYRLKVMGSGKYVIQVLSDEKAEAAVILANLLGNDKTGAASSLFDY